MFGLRFFTRASNGAVVLASRHPRTSGTWFWSVSVERRAGELRPYLWNRSERRSGQWHDFYSLPFGWTLIVSQQDYHRTSRAAA